jgi:hypothetical protein
MMPYKDKAQRQVADQLRYQLNRDARRARMREYMQTHPRAPQPASYFVSKNQERRQGLREFLVAQKAGKSCQRCGNNDWRVLDFHHLDPSVKEGTLNKAIARNWSKEHILQEITKCEVLCANCHRILHWEARNGDVVASQPAALRLVVKQTDRVRVSAANT